MSTEILTVAQAATYLGLSRQTIYLRIWSGELQPVYLLGKAGIPLAVLEPEKKQREMAAKPKKKQSNGRK